MLIEARRMSQKRKRGRKLENLRFSNIRGKLVNYQELSSVFLFCSLSFGIFGGWVAGGIYLPATIGGQAMRMFFNVRQAA